MNRKRFVRENPKAKRSAFIPFLFLAIVSGTCSPSPGLSLHPRRDAGILNLMWGIYAATVAEFLLTDILTGPAESWTRSERLRTTREFLWES